jgi:hypothetical protein
MNDTSPEIEAMIRELYSKRTVEERLDMLGGMHTTAVGMVRAGVLHQNPGISEKEMRWEVFLRFYSDCYDEEEKTKIRAFLCG